ncbi:HvfC family RiPP maturation protein [Lysobacter sp. F60174L2]|uniref:HvfC family RiPP maturation protein n=1 Tax=Lysobacter sp. F60174L2 TaxID=3459295 RepID=UPI00403DFA9C
MKSALADYIRDPDHALPPEGIEPRRLKVYQELFFNNIESMLAGNFPVIRRIFSSGPEPDRWTTLVRDFYREHPSRTPLFTELAREFVRYLEARAGHGDTPPRETSGARVDRNDPPWLPELAHYEWVELALQISEARADDIPHDPDGDLLDGRPLLSPLAWPLSYNWPVHRIGPDYQPAGDHRTDAPANQPDMAPTPTFLLVQRDAAGKVHFQQLSALTFRLLQRLDQHPGLAGRDQLAALAAEAGVNGDQTFIEQGRVMLQQLHVSGVVLGTRTDTMPC